MSDKIVVRVPEKVGRGYVGAQYGADRMCTLDCLRFALNPLASDYPQRYWDFVRQHKIDYKHIAAMNDAIEDDAKRREFCIFTLSAIPGVEVIA